MTNITEKYILHKSSTPHRINFTNKFTYNIYNNYNKETT